MDSHKLLIILFYCGFYCFCVVSGNSDEAVSSCPNIITRKSWGAKSEQGINYLTVPMKYVIIHHTVSDMCTNISLCSTYVRNIQAYHIDTLDYWDIGYNFLIGNDGNVYEGIGWHKQGAHLFGWNKKSIGIAFIGDFSNTLPPEASLTAAKNLLACGVELGELEARFSMYGARQISPSDNPGLKLYQEIQDWPEWTSVVRREPESNCPNIITKKGWGARSEVGINYLEFPMQYVIIHHTVSEKCADVQTCSSNVRNIQAYHLDTLNYWDISYNFLIGNDGNVYEGVGWHKQGAHSFGWNTKSIGIAFIGDFSDSLPTEVALTAAKRLLACGVELGELNSRFSLIGGRQISQTESPGLRLYQEIQDWPEWASVVKKP